MNDEKEKWIEGVFDSMKGSQRAKPGPVVFAKIKTQITGSTTKVVPMHQWKNAAAAAAMILLVNVTALLYYNQINMVSYDDAVVTDTYSQSLISSYQIYE